MSADERRLCELNELADHWAKAGAELAAPPSWQAADAKAKLHQEKRALEYVAAFRIAATDGGHTVRIWTRPPPPRGASQSSKASIARCAPYLRRRCGRLPLRRLRHAHQVFRQGDRAWP